MNAKDNLGKTPLIIAVEEKLPGIVKILLEAEENLDMSILTSTITTCDLFLSMQSSKKILMF